MVVGNRWGIISGAAEALFGCGLTSSLHPAATAIKAHENKVASNFISYSLQIVGQAVLGESQFPAAVTA
jgi:hypothetical protein